MTLKNVLDLIPGGIDNRIVRIEYRTEMHFHGKKHDIFTGVAMYGGGHLASVDGDKYSFDDPVVDWQVTSADNEIVYLTVYEP